jgi:hypothetical protein
MVYYQPWDTDRLTYITVNGVDQGTISAPNVPSPNYGISTKTIPLIAGSNTIVLSNGPGWGPHWDYLDVPVVTYIVTASAGANGVISPAGAVFVAPDGSQAFTITANPNYAIDQVLVDGVNNPAAVASGSYTFSGVRSDHTIRATFKLAAVSVANLAALKAQVGNTVNLTGTVTVTCKGSGLFFVGEESYKGCIKVVGSDVVTTGAYLTNLTGLVSVDVYGQYTLTLSAPVSTATTGNVIKLVGTNNKAAKTDAKLRTNKVRLWGNVSGSTITDGYTSPITVVGGTLGTGVVVLDGVLWQEGGSVVLYQNLP